MPDPEIKSRPPSSPIRGDSFSVPLRVRSPFIGYNRPYYHRYNYPYIRRIYPGMYPYYTTFYPYYNQPYPYGYPVDYPDYYKACYQKNIDGTNTFVGCYKDCGNTNESATYTNFSSCCQTSYTKDSPNLKYGAGGNCPFVKR